MAAKPAFEGSISINEGSGPFRYGDTLSFTSEASHLQGGYPMVAVHLFQGESLAWVQLNHPEEPVVLGAGSSALDHEMPAEGMASLYRYAWKGGKESIDELARVEFSATP